MRALLIVFALCAGACGARTGLIDDPAVRDAGVDAGVDAGIDAGVDAGIDAGVDAGIDAGPDAGPAPRCGDGEVDPGEECDLGPRNADIPAYAVRQSGDFELLARPVGTQSSSADFYAFSSESAHIGFEAPRRANLFLYQETDRGSRSLLLTFSEDDGGFDGTAIVDLEGFDEDDQVLVSDDRNELTTQGGGRIRGRFAWFSNSDGGVVSLTCPRTVEVTLGRTTEIDDWAWVDGDGTLVALDQDEPVTIECNVDPSPCRTSCRLPACGDAFLDPGEECDDGNRNDGDTCPATCDLP